MIEDDDEFELITYPELSLLTYRYVPAEAKALLSDPAHYRSINELLNRLTKAIQKSQREAGRSFVSRTRFEVNKYPDDVLTVFRVVIANPLTTVNHLRDILAEQKAIALQTEAYQALMDFVTQTMVAPAVGYR